LGRSPKTVRTCGGTVKIPSKIGEICGRTAEMCAKTSETCAKIGRISGGIDRISGGIKGISSEIARNCDRTSGVGLIRPSSSRIGRIFGKIAGI